MVSEVKVSSVIDTNGGLARVLERINAVRRRVPASGWNGADEEGIESLFLPSQKLAVYGSLAPGRQNHSVLESLGGRWADGFVRGQLHAFGWGANLGYPGFRWDPQGDTVPINVLSSGALMSEWIYLDHFEGEQYVRILVPVENGSGVFAVANLYALREDS